MATITRESSRRDTVRTPPRGWESIRELALEYAESTRRSTGERRYVQQPRDGALRYATFQYLPEQHFRMAYDRLMDRHDIEPDGGYDTLHSGTRPATVYYWLNPATGGALYHTGINAEETVPFFPDEATAHDYLENQALPGEHGRYEGVSLYQARTRKVGDAVDVLTDQAGFEEFLPDGGLPQEERQPGTVWFWYNPSLDSIVQEEIAPYDVRGVFATEGDAGRFLDWYAREYGVVDTSHLELYSAEIHRQGFGRKHIGEKANRSAEPPEQVDFEVFQTDSDVAGGSDRS